MKSDAATVDDVIGGMTEEPMSSVIRLICPNLKCRKVLAVPEATRGKTVRCRACGMKINVPGDKPSPTPVPADADDTDPTV